MFLNYCCGEIRIVIAVVAVIVTASITTAIVIIVSQAMLDSVSVGLRICTGIRVCTQYLYTVKD